MAKIIIEFPAELSDELYRMQREFTSYEDTYFLAWLTTGMKNKRFYGHVANDDKMKHAELFNRMANEIKFKQTELKTSFKNSRYGQDKDLFIRHWNGTLEAQEFPQCTAERIYYLISLSGDEYKYVNWLNTARRWVRKSPHQFTERIKSHTNADQRIIDALNANRAV